ncbi:MAG: hypothetical protein ACRDVM_07405 [Acidimicrobiia bacterium]
MRRPGMASCDFPEAQTFVTTTRPEEVPMSGKRWSVGESGVW